MFLCHLNLHLHIAYGYTYMYVCVCLIPYASHRRGSNVSLTLDMCTPGCTEPYGYGAQLSPRDQSAQEYLRQGTHMLTPAMLHTRAMDDQSLQAEFYVSAATTAHPPTLFRLTDTDEQRLTGKDEH